MPLAAHDNVIKLTNYIGALVRDNIPVRFQYWKGAEVTTELQNEDEVEHENAQQYVVPNIENNMTWTEVQLNFSFPEGTNLANVRTWAIQMGAIAFQSYKKRLNKDYIKKELAPVFTKKRLAKLRDHWDSFVQYKQTQEATKMIATKTINVSRKKEFYKLGSGGYKVAMPKWDKMEHDCIACGLVATIDWLVQARTCYYAHGDTINTEDGTLLLGDQITEMAERLVDLVCMTGEGTFMPNQERDELSAVIQ
jgi:hypothetical protein